MAILDIDTAIEALSRKAADFRLNELLRVSSTGFKIQPNLDSLYEAESLEQVAKYLEELKEARIRLSKIEQIVREAFNDPETLDINLYRAQALANILHIFEYDTDKED